MKSIRDLKNLDSFYFNGSLHLTSRIPNLFYFFRNMSSVGPYFFNLLSLRLELNSVSHLIKVNYNPLQQSLLFYYIFLTFVPFFEISKQVIINLYRLYLIKSRFGIYYYLGRPFRQRTYARTYKKKKTFFSVHKNYRFFFRFFN